MKRLLIAEDTPDVQAFLVELLCGASRECVAASDGAAAIRLYDEARRQNAPFDLLILDAAMPEKTGFEVAGHVRGVEGNDDTPIIVITAHSESPLITAHANYVRVTEVCYKPLDADDFKRRVELILSGEAKAVTV